jgi:hypothetical protein
MPWGRLDDRANANAKLLALSDAAWRMWGCGLIYCQFNLTNGLIPDHAIHTFGVRARNKEAVAEELCAVMVPGKGPCWHRVDGGYQVHDYLDWNDSREDIEQDRAAGRARLERFRKRKLTRISNALHGPLQTEHDTRSEQVSTTTTTEDRSGRPERSRRTRARVFVGSRLKVSAAQHQVLLDELGSQAACIDWPAQYAVWDAELVETGEEFDTLPFIKTKAADVVQGLRRGGPARASDEAADRLCEEQRVRREQAEARATATAADVFHALTAEEQLALIAECRKDFRDRFPYAAEPDWIALAKAEIRANLRGPESDALAHVRSWLKVSA